MNYIITRCDNPDELMHYGVLGMKWGKRKASYTNAGNTIKRLIDPTSYIKKDGYQKSRNPIGTTISKDGYKKQKTVPGTRSNKAQNIISKYKNEKAVKAAKKAYKKVQDQKMKDLQKQYGDLEDKLTYGKKENKSLNSKIYKQLNELEKKMNQ